MKYCFKCLYSNSRVQISLMHNNFTKINMYCYVATAVDKYMFCLMPKTIFIPLLGLKKFLECTMRFSKSLS